MSRDKIIIKGAREHNLKNIDVEIPRDQLVVITGLSGSGKSSLAFDTIYAEGQRRYVESLSSYARQFLGQMDKPDLDHIEGLSPAISIDQKTTSKNPRSTVGTVTEIHDYLRLLYARIGEPHCPKCGRRIERQSVDQIVDAILSYPEDSRLQILAPVARGRKGEYQKVFSEAKSEGFVRVRVDGIIRELSESIKLDKQKKHSIELVIDRIIIRPDVRRRLADSVELALSRADGLVMVLLAEKQADDSAETPVEEKELLFSQNFACVECGISIEEINPRMFSFNNPFGACPTCSGLGFSMNVDENLLITDPNLSIRKGGLMRWSENVPGWYMRHIEAVFEAKGYSLDTPMKDLPREALDAVFYGCGKEKFPVKYRVDGVGDQIWPHHWEGLVNNYERRYRETNSPAMKEEIERLMSKRECPDCRGARLKPESLAVLIGGKNIYEISCLSIKELKNFFAAVSLTERQLLIGGRILKEINERLDFLVNVGLNYLSLSRSSGTLSGGEAQRIRLATQIGSYLMGVLYILDEPSTGLHQRDNMRLIETLKRLRDLGNTVLVVEHDEDTMREADYIIDIGPYAGVHGGELVAAGTLEDICRSEKSITGQYLSGRLRIEVPAARRQPNGKWLTVRGATVNNLKNIDAAFPLGLFIAVTGVSGSGKSSLINEILYKAAAKELNRARHGASGYTSIEGMEFLDKVINIDQSPIGRTPRSNPATYTGVFDLIRDLFSQVPESKMHGYTPGRFSFNVKGGRCESCHGDGIIKIEMHFLPDIYVPCEVCKGSRYNRETLEAKYKGKSIADVLDMTVEEGLKLFVNIPRIARKLQTLYDVGLSYIKLGQSATTLSGGEAQRVKLATELSRRSNGRTLYILDEPTTGLHSYDIRQLLEVLQRLVESGDTVLVIEHNLDVIKTADYIIDLGPEGGDMGGSIVAVGTPEQIAKTKGSYTGHFVARMLKDK